MFIGKVKYKDKKESKKMGKDANTKPKKDSDSMLLDNINNYVGSSTRNKERDFIIIKRLAQFEDFTLNVNIVTKFPNMQSQLTQEKKSD